MVLSDLLAAGHCDSLLVMIFQIIWCNPIHEAKLETHQAWEMQEPPTMDQPANRTKKVLQEGANTGHTGLGFMKRTLHYTQPILLLYQNQQGVSPCDQPVSRFVHCVIVNLKNNTHPPSTKSQNPWVKCLANKAIVMPNQTFFSDHITAMGTKHVLSTWDQGMADISVNALVVKEQLPAAQGWKTDFLHQSTSVMNVCKGSASGNIIHEITRLERFNKRLVRTCLDGVIPILDTEATTNPTF